MAVKFVKQNEEPIHIIPPNEYSLNPSPSFMDDSGGQYYLSEFIRCHNNPWITDNFPEYIHAYHEDYIWNPLYIELIDDEHINIYEEVEA